MRVYSNNRLVFFLKIHCGRFKSLLYIEVSKFVWSSVADATVS